MSSKKKKAADTAHGKINNPGMPGLCGHRAVLTRRDVILFEQILKDAIQSLIPFKGHSIHFPRSNEEKKAEWLDGEKKLLLPLLALADSQGLETGHEYQALPKQTLGIFMARGVSKELASPLMRLWPSISLLLTRNLLLHKQSLSDPTTGLASRHYLLECMAREIESLRDPFVPEQNQVGNDKPAPSKNHNQPGKAPLSPSSGDGRFAGGTDLPRRPSMGTLVIRLAELKDVVREFGYQFADQLMVALADAFIALCPEQALASRTGDLEFALHIPSATSKACKQLAEKIAASLATVFVLHPMHMERVAIRASVGYTIYPKDMGGDIFVRAPTEQARLILRKARLAAALADDDRPIISARTGAPPVLGFGQILAEGGSVMETLPLSRVMINLGAGMHAREGQRFSVWSVRYPVQGTNNPSHETDGSMQNPPLYKGEIVLIKVEENISQGEIIHLGDPSWSIEPGDRLVLLPGELSGYHGRAQGQERRDPVTGFLRHGDFFSRLAEKNETCHSYVLSLVRIGARLDVDEQQPDSLNKDETGELEPQAPLTRGLTTDAIMAKAAQACREELGLSILGGRYGLNSFIFFHPDMDQKQAAETYANLVIALEKHLDLDTVVGIASYPCLDFRKSDTLENCRKALDYALLLPKPSVGILDTLALNISADKRFSHGDTFGAIKEYQLSILAEEENAMAWNSLGVCLAGIGKQTDAERHFYKALEYTPDDPAVLYNLGYIYQSRGEDAQAERFYQKCLEHASEHFFAFVRLGQLAENKGHHSAARQWFEKAAALPDGEGPTCRHFARLCLNEGKAEEAREYLHEALLHDPQDAFALQLLARVYLDAGEDPELAASLARQSVALRPALKPGWLELARALSVMGKEDEARQARLRSGQL